MCDTRRHGKTPRQVALNFLTRDPIVFTIPKTSHAERVQENGGAVAKPRPKFGHAVSIELADGLKLICSYHPSQQNTFTGRLTEPMLDQVFARAAELATA